MEFRSHEVGWHPNKDKHIDIDIDIYVIYGKGREGNERRPRSAA